MKTTVLFRNIVIGIGLLCLVQGCDTTSENEIVIGGEVTQASSGNAIEGALVEITAPEELAGNYTQTNEQGIFSFAIEIDEPTDITIQASFTGYANVSTSVRLAPGNDVSDLDIELGDSGNTGGGGGGGGSDGGDTEVGGEAGGPASITLNNLSSETINVAETGGIVNTAFTFEVEDSAGRAVGQGHQVEFEIIRGPGGGESITPLSGETNPKGMVTSNLFSGDSSGTVRIEARIERPDVSLTIRSSPVLISISSGFPHPNNFNVAPRVYNFDGYGYIDENHTNNITASVGDLKGNPVKVGTAVYFSASNGGLVNGSASTNENGYASVNMSANGSTPSGHPMGPGFIDVVSQTVDKDNNYIEETTTLLLTTPEPIITITDPSPATINVGHQGSQSFQYTVTDLNGYPMAAGTQISVTVGEGLAASGDVDFQLGDFFTPGPGSTEFGFVVDDVDDQNSDVVSTSLTITVTSPSGVSPKSLTIYGTRAKVK